MKRLIFTLSLILCFAIFTVGASASQVENEITDTSEGILTTNPKEFDLKAYVGEKLLPILVSAFSGLIGLISSVCLIKNAIKGLSNKADTLKNSVSESENKLKQDIGRVACEIEKIKSYSDEIAKTKDSVIKLNDELCALIKESHNMSRMVALGFMGDEKAMRDGRATKIFKLLEKSNDLLGTLGIKTDTYGRILDKNEVIEGEKA